MGRNDDTAGLPSASTQLNVTVRAPGITDRNAPEVTVVDRVRRDR